MKESIFAICIFYLSLPKIDWKIDSLRGTKGASEISEALFLFG